MKQLYLLLFTLFTACLIGCLEEPDMDPNLQNALAPELEKFTMDNVDFTATTIVAKATVKKENGDPVTERGFIYWLKGTNEVQTQKETDLENGKGEFKQEIKDLKNDTVYYISPYARNKKGITYGDTLDINTKAGIGRVITSKVTDITATSAVVGGTIRDKGEGEIKMIGFNLYKNSELDSVIKINMDEMPTDSTFIHTLTELEPETDYIIEAIVENSFGQFNTDKQSFKTPDGHPELGFLSVIETDYTQVTVRAKLVKKGDGELDSIGFCWSDVKAVDRPDIKQDSTIKCTVNEDGFFVGVIPNLKAQTQYFVRSYAVNAFGTIYTSDNIAISTKSDAPTIFMDESLNYKMKDGNVTVSGVLQNDGRSKVSEIIICYSSVGIPKPGKNEGEICLTREDLDTDNKFEVSFKLKGNKTYNVMAYATNDFAKEEPSNMVSFTTPNIISTNKLEKFPGDGRMNYALFTLGDQAFVVGGDLGPSRTDELYGYSAVNNEWKLFESYGVKAMNMAACTVDNTAYLFGGNTYAKNITDCYSYNNNVWTSLVSLENDNIRSKAVCFSFGDFIYLIGGNINNLPTDTICYYDIKNNTWNSFGKFEKTITDGIALTFEDNVYVGLGEKTENRGLWKASGGDFANWEPLKEPEGKMGNVSTGIIYNRSIYVIDEYGVIWQYSLDENVWHQRSTCPGKSKNFELFVLNGTIYILGLDYYTKDLMTYDPSWDN